MAPVRDSAARLRRAHVPIPAAAAHIGAECLKAGAEPRLFAFELTQPVLCLRRCQSLTGPDIIDRHTAGGAYSATQLFVYGQLQPLEQRLHGGPYGLA